MECPICKTVIEDPRSTQFCPTCHWELVVISADASQGMKDYFEQRRKAFQSYYSIIEEIPSLKDEIKKLEKEKKSLEHKIKERDTELETCNEALSVEEQLCELQREIDNNEASVAKMDWDTYQADLKILKEVYEQARHMAAGYGMLDEIKEFLINKGLLPKQKQM